MQGYEYQEKNGVKYITFPLFSKTGLVVHGFSTRHQGVSPEPYDSLNMGYHVQDKPEYVRENRARFARALGVDSQLLVAGAQVHGDQVQIVTREHLGRGANSNQDALPGVDALVTNTPCIPLVSFYADCVPIFLLDPVARVIALAHAGWKGTLLRIASKTVSAMEAAFGCRPGDCLAVIGPAIGYCCYQVDLRVISKLRGSIASWQHYVQQVDPRHWKLNLPAVNRAILLESGLKDQHVVAVDLCTACHAGLFYSHRFSGGRTGRMGSLMMLK